MTATSVKPERGIVIDIGGEERRIRFDVNALIDLEDALNIDIMERPESIVELFEKPTLRRIRTLLWAGLLHENPNLTLREAGALIDTENMNVVGAAMRGVFFGALPEPKAEEAAEAGETEKKG